MAQEDSTREPRSPQSLVWLPRYRFYTVFVLTGLAMAAPIINFLKQGLKGDFWWVYASGRWMAQHHRILTANPASWNGPGLAGKTWVNLEWGWQWFIYAANPHAHPLGYIVLLFVFEALMLAAFLWAVRAIAPRLTIEAAIGTYALYAVLVFPYTIKLRAELFSYAAFPLLLGILWRAREERRWLWALAPLTLLWANVHGSWLMIPVLAVLEAGLWGIRRRWRDAGFAMLAGVAMPVAVTTLLTPFHFRTLTYAWWLDHNHYITGYIQEWQSVNFHSVTFLLFGAAVFAAWLWRAQRRLSYPFILDLWFVGTTLAFFDEVRMVTYFGMVFALWLAYGLAQSPRWQDRLQTPAGLSSRRWAPAAALLVSFAVMLVVSGRSESRWTAAVVPPALVAWLNQHPHQVVLAPIDDGGYLEAHGVHGVFADGRSDFLLANGTRFQDYVKIIIDQSARPGSVARMFRSHDVDAILWPSKQMNDTLAWFIARHHWQKAAVRGAWTVYMPPR